VSLPPRQNSWPGKYLAIHAPELVVKPDFQIFDDIADRC
jgi:hypothetical protein